MSYTASDLLSLHVGRQMLSYGNGLIIGNNNWGNTSRYFDAARARFTYDVGTTDIFFSKVFDGGFAATEAADHELYGLYSALNPDMGVIKNADLYALWNDNRTSAATRSRLATLGVRVDGDINVVDYNLEVSAQFGKVAGADLKGVQASANAGTKLMKDHRVAFGIDYANTEFANQFEDSHAQLGKADIVSRNNVLAFSLLTAWKLHEKWAANIDGYYFMAPKDDVTVRGGVTPVGAASGRQIGLEGDLALAYSPEKSITFDCGYNIFKGMSGIKGNDKVYSGLFVEGTATF